MRHAPVSATFRRQTGVRWREAGWLSALVDVAAVSDGNDEDKEDIVVNLVHDEVVTGADTPLTVPTGEFLGSAGSGLIG